MTSPVLDTQEESPLWRALPQAEAIAEKAIAAAAAGAGVRLLPGAEVSLLLTDDAHMREINQQWRDKDKPTNVLSFPAVEGPKVSKSPFLGDIAVAFDTLQREAEDAERMEALEVAILATLGVADPYADRPLDEETPSVRMA